MNCPATLEDGRVHIRHPGKTLTWAVSFLNLQRVSPDGNANVCVCGQTKDETRCGAEGEGKAERGVRKHGEAAWNSKQRVIYMSRPAYKVMNRSMKGRRSTFLNVLGSSHDYFRSPKRKFTGFSWIFYPRSKCGCRVEQSLGAQNNP